MYEKEQCSHVPQSKMSKPQDDNCASCHPICIVHIITHLGELYANI